MKLNLDDIIVPPTLLREPDTDTSDIEPSIREDGDVLHPILVRHRDDGRYELVAGSRRLLASKRAGLSAISVNVRDHMSDRAALRAELIENAARRDLPAHRFAQGVLTLISLELEERGMDFPAEEVKRRLWRVANEQKNPKLPREESGSTFGEVVFELFEAMGKSFGHFVTNIMPALSWPDDIRDAMERGLPRSSARTLAQIDSPELRHKALEQVEAGKRTAQQARAEVLKEAAQVGQLQRDLAAGEFLEEKARRRIVDGYLTPPVVFEWPEATFNEVLPWSEHVPELLGRFVQPGQRVQMMLADVADVDAAYDLGAAVYSVAPEPRFDGENTDVATAEPELTLLYWRDDMAQALGVDGEVDMTYLIGSLMKSTGQKVLIVPISRLRDVSIHLINLDFLYVLVHQSGRGWIVCSVRQE